MRHVAARRAPDQDLNPAVRHLRIDTNGPSLTKIENRHKKALAFPE